jgi:uncharacterized protein DUF4062
VTEINGEIKKVYLSSTYQDLIEHRASALNALRKMGLWVVNMEDYPASDERPLKKCLDDVARSDLYVGVFAHRFGYVPEEDNPDGYSITELEWRKAVELNKPRLVFMTPDGGLWKLEHTDSQTGEGDGGAQIKRLRAELRKERVRDEFSTPAELAAAVSPAVDVWLRDKAPAVSTISSPRVPHPRQISYDLLVLHAPADEKLAGELAAALSDNGWRTATYDGGLTAANADDLMMLDRQVTSARNTVVLLSPTARTMLAENQGRSARNLGLVRARGGTLIAIATDAAMDVPGGQFDRVLVPSADQPMAMDLASKLFALLVADRVDGTKIEIGLPVVIVAMTGAEAAALLDEPPEPVAALLAGPGAPDADQLKARYGTSRDHWRPYIDDEISVARVLDAAGARVNSEPGLLANQCIRLQNYPLDPLTREMDNMLLWRVYHDIARTGCVVVVDELSMFHQQVRAAFASSPLPAGPQVAFVTLCPWNPVAGTPHALIEKQLSEWLDAAHLRFGTQLDPLCELRVPERRRLDRWLRVSLPQTIDVLRDAPRDDEKVRRLAGRLGRSPDPSGIAGLVAGEGFPG